MDMQAFITAGLTEQQARVYLLLIENGELTPPTLARKLKLSRTNAYKILDKLVELKLALKDDSKTKTVYRSSSPMMLLNIVAEQRNKVTAQEQAIKGMLNELMDRYHSNSDSVDVAVVHGREAVIAAYRHQIATQQPLHFIRSRADVIAMSFDTMHEIRMEPATDGTQRFGITPDITGGPTNPDMDTKSNLTRTWMKLEDYDAPVEWSVSGSSLLIIIFGEEPHAITITNTVVADAFRQLWVLLNGCLRAMSYYSELPRTNK